MKNCKFYTPIKLLVVIALCAVNLFLNQSNLFAQVKIHDRVEIKPRIITPLKLSSIDEFTLEVDAKVDAEVDLIQLNNYYSAICCINLLGQSFGNPNPYTPSDGPLITSALIPDAPAGTELTPAEFTTIESVSSDGVITRLGHYTLTYLNISRDSTTFFTILSYSTYDNWNQVFLGVYLTPFGSGIGLAPEKPTIDSTEQVSIRGSVVPIDNFTRVTNLPVGTPVNMLDNIMFHVSLSNLQFPDGSAEKDFDWGTIQSGFTVQATPDDSSFGDRMGHVEASCSTNGIFKLKWTGTCDLDIKGKYDLNLVATPDTINYGDTTHITAEMLDKNGNVVVRNAPENLDVSFGVSGSCGNDGGGGGGSLGNIIGSKPIKKGNMIKTKSATLPKVSSDWPNGYFILPDGEQMDYISQIPFVTLRDSGINYVADGYELKNNMESGSVDNDLYISANRCQNYHPSFINTDYSVSTDVLIESYELDVQVKPDTLHPKQKAKITVQKKYKNGTTEAFPPGQLFEIGTVEGCMAGHFKIGGDSGNYFKDVKQPFTFIADSTEDTTATEVKIRVGVKDECNGSGGGGMLGSVRDKPGDKTKKQNALQLLMTKKSEKNKIKDGETCGYVPFQYYKIYMIFSLFTKNKEPKLIITLEQTESPSYITGTPQMPNVKIKAKLIDCDYKGEIICQWKLIIKWTDPFGKVWTTDNPYEANNKMDNYEDVWKVNWNSDFIGGDDSWIEAHAIVDGKDIVADPLDNKLIILGKNPDPADAYSGFNIYERKIMKWESYYQQFYNDNGYPKVNVNHDSLGKAISADYGIMMINTTNNPILEEVWNWKKNKDHGIILMYDAEDYAEKWPAAIRANKFDKDQCVDASADIYRKCPDFSSDQPEQLWKETYARYNGCSYKIHYWMWYPPDKNNPDAPSGWESDGNSARATDYADKVWKVVP